MDLLSLRYFVEVAKDLHITRTANRLYISQQSLSNHIQRLEKHYGVQLLKRKPTLQLTLAGEELLRFAEAMIQENANLTDRLFDIQQGERALLRFGASPGRLNVCLPIISKFAADLCRDNGQSALADKAELAGRVSLIILSLPFFKSIVNVATSLIA